jgi:hypothetical protein
MLRKSTAALALCIILVLAAAIAGRASASNAAFVVNHGQQVGDNCSATNGTDVYTGYITHLVATSSGHFNIGCQLWGPPVAQTMDFNGLSIDPSGHATLSENGVQ